MARFISVDPLQHKYPYYTPYQYAGNKPITYIDLDGLEEASTPLMNGVYFVEISNFSIDFVKRGTMNRFTNTILGKYDAKETEYYINLQQYKASSPGVMPFIGAIVGGNSSDWTVLGQNIENGKISGSETDDKRGYFAQNKEGKWVTGLGNPPEDSIIGFGGGIPVIINGQKYGEKDTDNVLSSRGYANQNSEKL